METSKQTYKQQGHISLFDNEETMDKLNAMGNPLEKLSDTRPSVIPRFPRTGQRDLKQKNAINT